MRKKNIWVMLLAALCLILGACSEGNDKNKGKTETKKSNTKKMNYSKTSNKKKKVRKYSDFEEKEDY